MLIGLITFGCARRDTLGDIGLAAVGRSRRAAQSVKHVRADRRRRCIARSSSCWRCAGVFTINAPAVAAQMRDVMLAMAAARTSSTSSSLAGLTTDEKKRVAVIIVLFVFATIFWSAFEQAPTSLNLFAADFTDRNAVRLGSADPVAPVDQLALRHPARAGVRGAVGGAWAGAGRTRRARRSSRSACSSPASASWSWSWRPTASSTAAAR